MKPEGYNEHRERSRWSFPFEYHYVTSHHPRYNMPYHWHIEYEIIRILQGELLFSFDEKTFTAQTGDVLFAADGTVHGCTTSHRDCAYECIVFELRIPNDICRTKIQEIIDHKLTIAHHFTAEHKPIQQAAERLFQAVSEKLSGYEFMVQSALYQFFGEIFANNLYSVKINTDIAKANRRHISQLKQVFNLIETTYPEPLTLQQLADIAGLSSKYFCKFFKDITQRTPIDYLNYYRIECACDKLISAEKPLLDIAYECGFNDFSYFIKTFRKYKGTTPNKFLLAYKQAGAKQNPIR